MAGKGNAYIGTSGWHYKHWRGIFYPEHLKESEYLDFYQNHFNTVEINTSFYHLPAEKTVEKWREQAARHFRFSAKGSRYITHMKKLNQPEETLARFFGRMALLGEKLDTVLFQLPPRWQFNHDRLHVFLRTLTTAYRYAFEFRDVSWIRPETYDLLARYNAAFCIYEFDGFSTSREVTADFVYIRLHGPDGPYQGSYSEGTLADWALSIASWTAGGKDVFCYFDNDQNAYAALNAKRLGELVAGA